MYDTLKSSSVALLESYYFRDRENRFLVAFNARHTSMLMLEPWLKSSVDMDRLAAYRHKVVDLSLPVTLYGDSKSWIGRS